MPREGGAVRFYMPRPSTRVKWFFEHVLITPRVKSAFPHFLIPKRVKNESERRRYGDEGCCLRTRVASLVGAGYA